MSPATREYHASKLLMVKIILQVDSYQNFYFYPILLLESTALFYFQSFVVLQLHIGTRLFGSH